MGLYLAGLPMGSETSTAAKPGLRVNRHLSGYVAGTDKIKKLEIIRNGKVIKTFTSETYWLDFTFDDLTPLEKVVVDAKDKKPPFVFYYIRATQEDGHIAWGSPIWVDYVPVAPGAKAARRQQMKASKKPVVIEEEEEEDDFDDDYEE